MRHRKHTFKIGKTGAHRKAMIANMLTSLFEHGRIKTTVVKAKELRRWADKMITAAKIGDLHNRRKVISVIRPNMRKEKAPNEPIFNKINVVAKLFDEIAPMYKDRNGGYTRIVRLTSRKGDGAELCFIQLVEEEIKTKSKKAPASAEAPVEEPSVEEDTPVAEAPEEEKAEAEEAAPEEEKAEAEEAAPEEEKAEAEEDAPEEEKAEAEEDAPEEEKAEAEEDAKEKKAVEEEK